MIKRNRLLLIAMLIILGLTLSCRKAPEAKEAVKTPDGRPIINLTETKLSEIPEGYETGEVVFSDDGSRVAYAARKRDAQGARQHVVHGNTMGKAYDGVRDIALSPDGRNVAYSARIGEKEIPVVNGREGQPYETVCNPTFSPGGEEVAWEIQKGDRWYNMTCDVQDGRMRQSSGADMHFMRPVWSPDGRLVTYIEHHYEKKYSVRVVSAADMTDSKRGKEYDLIDGVVYSDDGWRIAYMAKRGEKFFVVEGDFGGGSVKEGPAYDNVGRPVFSPNGRHLAYPAGKEGKWFLVIDGREIPANGMNAGPVFSPDGSRVAYAASKEGKQLIVVDGREGPRYGGVSPPVWSPDGSEAAYAAARDGKWFIVVGDKEGPPYDIALSPVWSPDGRYLAYRVRKGSKKEGRRSVVVADRKGKVVREEPDYDAVWQAVFATDTQFGYGVRTGNELWWKTGTAE